MSGKPPLVRHPATINTVMLYGLANALSVFQAFINDMLRDMLGKHVVVYIDDILMYSPSLPVHVSHICEVLQRLISLQLYMKAEKCVSSDCQFLFGILDWPGGTENAGWVGKGVRQWPMPKSVRELQWFWGFAHFYQRLICNFSSVAVPLTAFLKGKPKDSASGSHAPVTWDLHEMIQQANQSTAPLTCPPNRLCARGVSRASHNMGICFTGFGAPRRVTHLPHYRQAVLVAQPGSPGGKICEELCSHHWDSCPQVSSTSCSDPGRTLQQILWLINMNQMVIR